MAQSRGLVRRYNAQNYLLITLISFSLSVIVTRVFLILTGYPKIGNGELHIAHLLWGGLLLFVATLILNLFANRWVNIVGALLSGIGVGLFIDEVGKFITQNNDYFYPLAMPIIYAFFLVVVVLYLQVRRPVSRNPRAEMYRALEMFGELLDHDLEPSELDTLRERLKLVVSESPLPDVGRLAQTLLDFLNAPTLGLVPEHTDPLTRLWQVFPRFEQRWIGPKHLKIILAAGMALVGGAAVINLLMLLLSPALPTALQNVLTPFITGGQIRGPQTLNWFLIQLGLEGSVGLLLLISSGLLLAGRDERGISLGYISLLLSLTVVNLLIFYYDQFGNIVVTLVDLALLFGLLRYRRYLDDAKAKA